MHKCDLCNNLSEHREPGFQPNKVCKAAGNDLAGALRACSAKECPYGGPFYGVRNNNARWISVKDRLPEKNDEYIVAVNTGIQTYSTWDVYHKSHGWLAENQRITHWMPFPEPPKEG